MTDPFKDRAEGMGLDISMAYKGLYRYVDRYSEVVYRQFTTGMVFDDPNGQHETDGVEIPYLGVFIQPADTVGFTYCGHVSNYYRFLGNDVLNQSIRDALSTIEQPIFSEVTNFSPRQERMRNEITIQSPISSQQAGDIYPLVVTHNGYNGTRAAAISFGLGTTGLSSGFFHFTFSLGQMRMVHIASMSTSLNVPINDYLNVFRETITETIERSFSTQLTEEDFLKALELIEEIGGKRRSASILSNLRSEVSSEDRMPSAWQMFVAIARYTTLEPNLNMKKMLENMAESVLIIPTRMQEVLARLEQNA